MTTIIGVQFQKNGKIYYFDANGFEAETGTYVIVDTVRGIDLGEVVLPNREMSETIETENLKKMIRLATEQDIQRSMENRLKEREAYTICQKKIAEHKLEMKLVSVEYTFDGSKILFYFTANGRVDFRSLVKDLASVFKMRIELRQIGVRDEAKMLGGLGPCGRPICCDSFLAQFQPVSIKMAKEQNLSLNPTKISGVCGRLMCCLKYEQDHYEQTRKKMPKIGRTVNTPDGPGPVTDLNILKETVLVRLTNGDTSEIKEYSLEVISRTTETAQPDRPPVSEPAESRPKETPAPEEKAEGKEEKPNDAGNREDNRGQNRNRNKNHQLGQPVKRENPNRANNNEKKTDNGTEKKEPARENREKKPETGKESGKETDKETGKERKNGGSSWADAVQNAILAIDKD